MRAEHRERAIGHGLVSSVVPTLYNDAGGCNAINSSLVKGCFQEEGTNFFAVEAKNLAFFLSMCGLVILSMAIFYFGLTYS